MYRNASSPATSGRARPTMRLTIVTTRPGTAIARNKNPSRTDNDASTSWLMRANDGDVMSAITSRAPPSGARNHRARPKSVTNRNDATSHDGACRAALIAAHIDEDHDEDQDHDRDGRSHRQPRIGAPDRRHAPARRPRQPAERDCDVATQPSATATARFPPSAAHSRRAPGAVDRNRHRAAVAHVEAFEPRTG